MVSLLRVLWMVATIAVLALTACGESVKSPAAKATSSAKGFSPTVTPTADSTPIPTSTPFPSPTPTPKEGPRDRVES